MVSVRRQMRMCINFIMKYQQLQMKLLSSKNSNKNKNSLLFTKRKRFVVLKDC